MKNVIEIDGRTYISSRRAAEMFKYSNDYVGQLCRAGKVPARMIARTWYVDQLAFLEHKKGVDESFRARCRNSVYKINKELKEHPPQIKLKEISADEADLASTSAIEKPVVSSSPSASVEKPKIKSEYVSHTPLLVYSGDDRPSLPPLNKKKDTDAYSSQASRAAAPAYDLLVRPILLERALKATTAMALAAVILGSSMTLYRSNPTFFSTENSVSYSASVSGAIQSFFAGIASVFDRALSILKSNEPESSDSLAVAPDASAKGDTYANSTVIPNSAPDYGMVVVPSTSNNDAKEEAIRNYFSDEVVVRPDTDGSSGIITPVFRERNGDDYLYVLVPISE